MNYIHTPQFIPTIAPSVAPSPTGEGYVFHRFSGAVAAWFATKQDAADWIEKWFPGVEVRWEVRG